MASLTLLVARKSEGEKGRAGANRRGILFIFFVV